MSKKKLRKLEKQVKSLKRQVKSWEQEEDEEAQVDLVADVGQVPRLHLVSSMDDQDRSLPLDLPDYSSYSEEGDEEWGSQVVRSRVVESGYL